MHLWVGAPGVVGADLSQREAGGCEYLAREEEYTRRSLVAEGAVALLVGGVCVVRARLVT